MNIENELRPLLTYDEVALLLRLNRQTLRQWVSEGKFPHLKIGSSVRFTVEMVESFITASKVENKTEHLSKTMKQELSQEDLRKMKVNMVSVNTIGEEK
ncbi:MAG: helix-turn-helix domain-containing protein [Sphaerochaeta sp.]